MLGQPVVLQQRRLVLTGLHKRVPQSYVDLKKLMSIYKRLQVRYRSIRAPFETQLTCSHNFQHLPCPGIS